MSAFAAILICSGQHFNKEFFSMLKDIHIKNYRGIKDLKIKDFKRINLLVGDNNSGKTSVLEAALLLLTPKNPLSLAEISLKKDISVQAQNVNIQLNLSEEESWRKLSYSFFNAEAANHISIASGLKNNPTENPDYLLKIIQNTEVNSDIFTNKTNISVSPRNIFFEYCDKAGIETKTGFSNNGNFKTEQNSSNDITGSGAFSNSGIKLSSTIYPLLNNWCTNLERKKIIRNVLKVIEPSLEDFEINQEISCYFSSGLKLPINYMGDGIRHLLNAIVAIYCSPNGIVLIDEIENGLHWKTQKVLWKAVIAAAKENDVQIIATTHSRDTIKALSEAYEEEEGKKLLGEDEIRLFQLYKNDKIFAETLDADTISGMIKNNYEPR